MAPSAIMRAFNSGISVGDYAWVMTNQFVQIVGPLLRSLSRHSRIEMVLTQVVLSIIGFLKWGSLFDNPFHAVDKSVQIINLYLGWNSLFENNPSCFHSL